MEKLRKGLKKGEYFEDGGRIFIIDEVLEDGKYTAHKVEAPEELEGDPELTVAELKAQLKALGLPTTGSKAELHERLIAADEEGTGEEGTGEEKNGSEE